MEFAFFHDTNNRVSSAQVDTHDRSKRPVGARLTAVWCTRLGYMSEEKRTDDQHQDHEKTCQRWRHLGGKAKASTSLICLESSSSRLKSLVSGKKWHDEGRFEASWK